jgi:transposase
MKKSLSSMTKTSKKVGHRDEDATVVTIDQFRKAIGADLTYAWFPVGERPTVPVSASREGLNFLGALTENGETLFLECDGSFTKDVTVHFLQTLQAKFGEKLVVVLDKGTYFTAKKVKQFAENSKVELLYLPTGMAKLNPTEECWRQLRSSLGNRYFGTIDELREAIHSAMETIDPPGVYQYLCR